MPVSYGRLHYLLTKKPSEWFGLWRLYFLTLSIIKIGKGCENENGKIDCQRNNFVNLHSSKPPKIKFQHMADRVQETPP